MLQRTRFEVTQKSAAGGGRIGWLEADRPEYAPNHQPAVKTPHVFPVINVIGGPPGPWRNGGLWRPVKWWMFLERRVEGFLCQVLHVLDFHIKDEQWGGWRGPGKSFPKWIADFQRRTEQQYVDEMPTSAAGRPDNGYPFRKWMKLWDFWNEPAGQEPKVPLTFLDSGGFALLKRDALQKTKLWYHLNTSPQGILELQTEMGGHLIASLDYPLPPGLSSTEIEERQKKSIANGLEMLELMAKPDNKTTALPYVAVHGVDYDSALQYMREFFAGWQQLSSDTKKVRFGLAIGSMVPRADNPRLVVEVVAGVMQGLREGKPLLPDKEQDVPVHVFGISSHLVGLLAYLEVDTFDSQTYADVAKRCRYMDEHLRSKAFLDVTREELAACGCYICERILATPRLFEDMQANLEKRTIPGVGSKMDYYKKLGDAELPFTRSDMYSLLAMHNWHRISEEAHRVRDAIANDRLVYHLVDLIRKEHWEKGANGQRGRKLEQALVWMAHDEAKRGESRLASVMQEVLGALPPLVESKPRKVANLRVVSTRTPDEFQIEADYTPPATKDILLLVACSKGKPYRTSAHQRQILKRLTNEFDEQAMQRVHKVTLSGLYGPVPEEREDEQPVTDYDFMLERGDTDQQHLVATRLRAYLERYAGQPYKTVFLFIFFAGYRDAVMEALKGLDVPCQVVICPGRVNGRIPQRQYLNELVEGLRTHLPAKTVPQMTLPI